MLLKEYIQLHGTEESPEHGSFSLTTQEGDNEPQTQKVPALKIRNLGIDELAYFREAFQVNNLPIASCRYGEAGMGGFKVNPNYILGAEGKIKEYFRGHIHTVDVGITDSILIKPEEGGEGTITGTTIHGEAFRAKIAFVPSKE